MVYMHERATCKQINESCHLLMIESCTTLYRPESPHLISVSSPSATLQGQVAPKPILV